MHRINNPNHARFLTFSTYQRLDLFGTASLRDVFVEQLARTQSRHEFWLYAWVLMPNHVHLLVREPETGELEGVLRTLKLGISKRILNRWRELDAPVLEKLMDAQGNTRFWQRGGGFDRNVWSDAEFDEKVGYIHMNPVRAGLVERPTDWAWSSAKWWSGDREGVITCDSRMR